MGRNLFSTHGFSPAEIARRTWAEIRADDVFGRAAQLAYYFFLALFPFLICVIASLSVFGTADRGRAVLFGFLARSLPGPASQLISQTFEEILRSGGPLKMSFGILASLWSASMGMSAVMDTLNAAYKVKETRSLVKQYAVAIALTCGTGVLLVISLMTAIFGDRIAAAILPGNVIAMGWKIGEWPLALALLLFAFAATYYFAPDLKNRRWHWITPGAVAGVILLVVVSLGFRAYLHYYDTYNAAYGSLGAVIVLLLYFYLNGLALLFGGALNGVLEGLARPEEAVAADQKGRRMVKTA